MDNESCESSANVTLVLRDCRVKANKDDLTRNSLYFASLFSEQFNDHRQKEFVINYEISIGTLQAFIDWANNEGKHSNSIDSKIHNFIVKKSLQKFLRGNHTELLELLELSVLFMAEKLTDDITDMIISMRFTPNEMLEVWLMADNLGLKVLENVALAICLDRFDDLMLTSLVDLDLRHFSKLLCNVNVRSSQERLMNVREAWTERNGRPTDISDSSVRFLNGEPEDAIAAFKKAKPRYIQCIVGRKLNQSQTIYSWNGEILQELVEIRRDIIASRVVARGFDIYVVGREQEGNVNNVNTTIWRYCIFNKKWYNETVLPQQRMFMAVAFLENKLYLFGGTDPNGQTFPTVDVYDVHTGIWSRAAEVSEPFRLSLVRSSCVAHGNKILCGRNFTHVYHPLTDTWTTYNAELPPIPGKPGQELVHMQFLIGTAEESNVEMPIVYVRIWLPMQKRTNLGIFTSAYETDVLIKLIYNWGKKKIDHQVINGRHIVSFSYINGCANVEVGEVRSSCKKRITANYQRLKTYSQELNDVSENCFRLDLGCFNLIEPETLHTMFTVPVKIHN